MSKRESKSVREFTLKELSQIVGFGTTWLSAAKKAGLGRRPDGSIKGRLTVADWNVWRAANPNFRIRRVRKWVEKR